MKNTKEQDKIYVIKLSYKEYMTLIEGLGLAICAISDPIDATKAINISLLYKNIENQFDVQLPF